jgi:hypothetical protein
MLASAILAVASPKTARLEETHRSLCASSSSGSARVLLERPGAPIVFAAQPICGSPTMTLAVEFATVVVPGDARRPS